MASTSVNRLVNYGTHASAVAVFLVTLLNGVLLNIKMVNM